MASADTVVIRVIGSGGHGAVPQRTVDPVVVCSAIVLALQSIVSRNVDPQDTAIVSVGAIHAGTVSNVIPASAEMILSVRALTAETRALLERRIGELARGQAASFGARAEVDYRHCHPVLVNHPGQTAFAREVARDWLGEECLIDGLRPFTASEDFAFILERCPGSYLVIGNGQGERLPVAQPRLRLQRRLPGRRRQLLRDWPSASWPEPGFQRARGLARGSTEDNHNDKNPRQHRPPSSSPHRPAPPTGPARSCAWASTRPTRRSNTSSRTAAWQASASRSAKPSARAEPAANGSKATGTASSRRCCRARSTPSSRR